MSRWLLLLLVCYIVVQGYALNDYAVERFQDSEGRWIDKITVPGIPVEKRTTGPVAEYNRNSVLLNGVPAFDWSYGCSATSAAMIAGYYDRGIFGHVYSGPTNAGVMPLDNSAWGPGECPLSATHQGYDGLSGLGHVDRFWTDNTGDDPFGYGDPTGTYNGCTADYMGTNQLWWGNGDGSTTFYFYVDGSALHDPQDGPIGPPYGRDGIHGLKLFFESRGYSVSINYNQYIYGLNGNTNGYTYDQYKASIDAGIPVMIQIEGHSMVGIGYDNASNTIYVHNTWDFNVYPMEWGGVYSGMAHYGVGVIQLDPPPAIGLSADTIALNLAPGATGTATFEIYNNGTGALSYYLATSETSSEGSDRSIQGSYVSMDATQYLPGTTMDWVFSVYNASPDQEWLKHVIISFPAGMMVNSVSNFVGGGGGDMVPSPVSGDGITIDWFGESGDWGVVYPTNTATATVNVTISDACSGIQALPWQIQGDIYGSEPHSVSGTITLSQAPYPVAWFHPLPTSGMVSPLGMATITGHFSAVGLETGTYLANMALSSNDPYNPLLNIPVTLTVAGNLPAEITAVFPVAGGMRVEWSTLPGAMQYRVYRSVDPYGDFGLLDTTSDLFYVDPNISDRAFYMVLQYN